MPPSPMLQLFLLATLMSCLHSSEVPKPQSTVTTALIPAKVEPAPVENRAKDEVKPVSISVVTDLSQQQEESSKWINSFAKRHAFSPLPSVITRDRLFALATPPSIPKPQQLLDQAAAWLPNLPTNGFASDMVNAIKSVPSQLEQKFSEMKQLESQPDPPPTATPDRIQNPALLFKIPKLSATLAQFMDPQHTPFYLHQTGNAMKEPQMVDYTGSGNSDVSSPSTSSSNSSSSSSNSSSSSSDSSSSDSSSSSSESSSGKNGRPGDTTNSSLCSQSSSGSSSQSSQTSSSSSGSSNSSDSSSNSSSSSSNSMNSSDSSRSSQNDAPTSFISSGGSSSAFEILQNA